MRKSGAPGPTRTGGLRIRSPTLYPTELRVRIAGVSEGIRTPGRWSHNPELYQLSYAHHKVSMAAQTSFTHRRGLWPIGRLFWHFCLVFARQRVNLLTLSSKRKSAA